MSILISAAQVLGCFGEKHPDLTVTDLVRLLAMPKSNASRLLRGMRDAGFLETIGDSKRYRPSLMLVEAGRAYRLSSSLLKDADAVVARVSVEFGHTGYVSKREGHAIIAVTDHPGTNALRVVSNIGRSLPAFATATGRSLLARLPDKSVEALYAHDFPPPPSATAPQTLGELLERLALIRTEAFAISLDEASRGVCAIAVAVGDAETNEEVALCIVVPAATSDAAERQAIAAALYHGALGIARACRDDKFNYHPSAVRHAA